MWSETFQTVPSICLPVAGLHNWATSPGENWNLSPLYSPIPIPPTHHHTHPFPSLTPTTSNLPTNQPHHPLYSPHPSHWPLILGLPRFRHDQSTADQLAGGQLRAVLGGGGGGVGRPPFIWRGAPSENLAKMVSQNLPGNNSTFWSCFCHVKLPQRKFCKKNQFLSWTNFWNCSTLLILSKIREPCGSTYFPGVPKTVSPVHEYHMNKDKIGWRNFTQKLIFPN